MINRRKNMWQLWCWPVIQTQWHLKRWISSLSHTYTLTQSKLSPGHPLFPHSMRKKKETEERDQERVFPPPGKRKESNQRGLVPQQTTQSQTLMCKPQAVPPFLAKNSRVKEQMTDSIKNNNNWAAVSLLLCNPQKNKQKYTDTTKTPDVFSTPRYESNKLFYRGGGSQKNGWCWTNVCMCVWEREREVFHSTGEISL